MTNTGVYFVLFLEISILKVNGTSGNVYNTFVVDQNGKWQNSYIISS